MDKPFFDLKPTADSHVWTLDLERRLCVGPPGREFMFGGVGLGSGIQALERSCQRRVIWAAAQYVSYARPGSTVTWTVTELTTGRFNTQATVSGRVDDQLIVTANAALGSRPTPFARQWLTAPDVRPAAVCIPIERGFPAGDGLHTQLDTRAAQLTNGDYHVATEDGRVLLWVKPHNPCALDAVLLAVVADYLPMGVGRALGTNMGGNSLDNTIRIHQIVPTEWLLCDLQIAGVHDGFGHGAMSLFAETGELLATAGQSLILRTFPSQPEGQGA